MIDGFCSKCHKVWTLPTEQGLCQWCGQPASRQTNRAQALRNFKSRSNGSLKQALDHSNGYDSLQGEWLAYYQVADRYAHRVRTPDREDVLHTIIANLADPGRNDGHKPDNASWMYRIANFTLAQYWRTYYKGINGLDCGNCSNPQRKRCKEQDLYRECPKAIRIESLNKPIVDSEGNLTELGELISDDKALDLEAWLDIKTFLLGCPDRLIFIAEKNQGGIPLNETEDKYLDRFRKKYRKQMSLL